MKKTTIIKMLCITVFTFLTMYGFAIAQIHYKTDGKVGIGITAPNYNLDVSGDINFTGTLYQNGNPFVSGGGSVWELNGENVYRPSGNVGIGTSSPDAKLHVEGTIEVDQKIRANDSGGLEFATDEGTTRMIIKDNGYIGIGTTSPEAKLDVVERIQWRRSSGDVVIGYLQGDGYDTNIRARYNSLVFEVDRTADNFRWVRYGTELMRLTGYGKVGIGTTSPSYDLEVNGSAGKPGGGTWVDSSDGRLKKNVKNLTGALDKLIQLQGVTFEWINPQEHVAQGGVQEKDPNQKSLLEKDPNQESILEKRPNQGSIPEKEQYQPYQRGILEKGLNQGGIKAGLIAQKVEEVFPEWVLEIEPTGKDKTLVAKGEKIKALYFPHAFNAYVIEAIKELKAEIDELKRENIALRARIEEL